MKQKRFTEEQKAFALRQTAGEIPCRAVGWYVALLRAT